MVDILLDADVYCDDGLGGRSVGIILDPDRKLVKHLIVAEISAQHTRRLVPINRVAAVTPFPIRLLCSRYELAQMSPLFRSDLVATDVPHYISSGTLNVVTNRFQEHKWIRVNRKTISPGELVLSSGVRVLAKDGLVGTLAGFIVDKSSGLISHLVLHAKHLLGERHVLISASHLKTIERDKVSLNLNTQQVIALPTVPLKR